MKIRRWLPFYVLFLFVVPGISHADDGDPVELGPMDIHEVTKTGLNQKILVIYAQANDHRILAGDLAALNTAEDNKAANFSMWFDETSWGQITDFSNIRNNCSLTRFFLTCCQLQA